MSTGARSSGAAASYADSVIRSQRVVTSAGVEPAAVHLNETTGRITKVSAWDDVERGAALVDAGELLVMPGLVDSHVHVNEPGRTEWEGFETALRAAAAGGVTTICDMPLNAIPATTTVSALEEKRNAVRAAGGSKQVEFIGGVVPGNLADLEPLAAAGVCAFKCFLAPSGVPEFAHVTEGDLMAAFPVLATLGKTLMVHAEDPAALASPPVGSDPHKYAAWLASRPVAAEHSAIALLIRLMDRWPTPVHIVHLSSASSLELVKAAQERGLPLTTETCPHYLTFAAEEIPDGATEFKCAPPIRGRDERDALWRALIAGEINLVASDHSPCPPGLKESKGDFFAAWGGIASLQLTLSAVWTGARTRGVWPEQLAEWMSAAPARLTGLAHRKGALHAGYDADLVIWDPAVSFRVYPEELLHRHPVTPYAARELYGAVKATYVSGRLAFGGV